MRRRVFISIAVVFFLFIAGKTIYAKWNPDAEFRKAERAFLRYGVSDANGQPMNRDQFVANYPTLIQTVAIRDAQGNITGFASMKAQVSAPPEGYTSTDLQSFFKKTYWEKSGNLDLSKVVTYPSAGEAGFYNGSGFSGFYCVSNCNAASPWDRKYFPVGLSKAGSNVSGDGSTWVWPTLPVIPTATPTVAPTPGPWAKLKDSSFVSGEELANNIPANPTLVA